jgi:hypothetical protein
MDNIGQYLMHILIFFGSLWFLTIAFGLYKILGDNYLNTFLSKRKIFVRILAIISVLNAGYELYDLSADKSWSKNEKELFKQELVIGFSKKLSADRQDIKNYCDCIVDNISQTIPYDDFIKNASVEGSSARKILKIKTDSCSQKYSDKLKNKSDR